MKENLRLVAARIIDAVFEGRSLSHSFSNSTIQGLTSRDRAFVQRLCYGVCRSYTALDAILAQLLKKPLKAKDSDLYALLLVGLYQLTAMRVPDYASVTETVNATADLKKTWARGFVNAILREYIRKREVLMEQLKDDLEVQYLHPSWWLDALKEAWPTNWTAILEANNAEPPFSLRVNLKKIKREAYLNKLEESGYTARLIPHTDSGFILTTPIAVELLPGFQQGEVVVQDGAAQLAAPLLCVEPGMRVLDACAAPGGKLCHLLERVAETDVIAIDNDKVRMQRIEDNLRRLHLRCQLICEDVANVSAWWDGHPFDRILLDAPCTASGVIRRHPDIKLLRQAKDIDQLAREQYRLLTALWPLLKPGGILLYATCSVFPEENEKLLSRFLEMHADAKVVPINAAWGINLSIGRQILPGMDEMDGFYYARLQRQA